MTANLTSESNNGRRDVSKSRPSLGVISSRGLLGEYKKPRCIRSRLLYARSRKIQRYAIRGLCFVPLSRLWLSQQWRQPPWLISRNKHAGAQESNGLFLLSSSFSCSCSLSRSCLCLWLRPSPSFGLLFFCFLPPVYNMCHQTWWCKRSSGGNTWMVQDGGRGGHQTNRAALRGHTNFPEATPSSRSIVRLRTQSRDSWLGVALLMVAGCPEGSWVQNAPW